MTNLQNQDQGSSTPTSLKASGLRVYFYALGLGLRVLKSRRFAEGIRLLIAPMGYFRLLPNAFAYQEFLRLKNPRILDVSSPKLLSVFLANLTSQPVYATDLDDKNIFTRWKEIGDAIGLKNYFVEYQDARRLTYADDSFDLVYSISVIEHIPGDGDTASLKEFRRVLKPGGILIIQVPYRRERQDIMLPCDSKGEPLPEPRFYERYYDLARLGERLSIDGLMMESRVIMGEWLAIDPWMNAANRLPRLVRIALMPFEPLLAFVNYWVRPNDTSGHPLGAVLVYRKVPLLKVPAATRPA